MIVQPGQFANRSLRQSPRGADICQLLAATLQSADAGQAIRQHVSLDDDCLLIDGRNYDLNSYPRVFVIGVGKAAVPMAQALCEILGRWLSAGLVITKKGSLGNEKIPLGLPVPIIEAGHPIPDPSNLDASQNLVSLLANVTRHDLVFCLLSGGGSAFLTRLAPGISLQDLQTITSLLLSCGADIGEINTIRKHLDELKGGKLARLIFPATLVSLILSDVVGDHLDRIASGPTAPDPTTFRDAMAVLEKYQIVDSIPVSIRSHLKYGMEGKLPETLKPGDPLLERVHNVIVGSNTQTALAAQYAAMDLGFNTRLLNTLLEGEASQAGRSLAETAKTWIHSPGELSRPSCLIGGGETTVTLRGAGKGGRNQELALGAVESLSGTEPFILVSLATDGNDGPTDAAGAVVTNQTYERGQSLGLDPSHYLANNDSYSYFKRLDDLIKTGPTLTNVNDLVFIFSL